MKAHLTIRFSDLLCIFFLAVGVVPLGVRAERPTGGGYASLPLSVLIVFCVLTVIMSAFYCGMTLGLLGINTTTLEIIAEAGMEPDRTNARRILPVRRLGHQLLVTLLLGNMLSIVLTSQFIAAIVNSTELVNFVVGTSVILIFGEIIPMSICNKGSNVLIVGGKSIPALKVSLWVLYPIAKPLGMLLDCVIKHEAGQIYDRNELKKLISLHCDKYSEKCGIDAEQMRIMLRVLELDERTAQTIMTPLKDAFMLEGGMVLDRKLLKSIWDIGKSRLPVYMNERTNIVGVLYVKDLLNFFLFDHRVSTTVYDFVMEQSHDIGVVDANLRIQEILAMFKNRVPHLLLVNNKQEGGDQTSNDAFSPVCPDKDHFMSEAGDDKSALFHFPQGIIHSAKGSMEGEKSNTHFIGILTLEDVIEELIASEIYDEDEYPERHLEPNGATLISSPIQVSPIHKMHVNFYSYGVNEVDQPEGRLDMSLTEAQKWVLADYLTRMYVPFATWSALKMKWLIDHVGDRIIRVSSEVSPRECENSNLLYRTGVPTSVFTLLLGGAARLIVNEKLSTELYSFSALAEEVFLNDASFVPNYTVVITRSSRVLQISREDVRMVETNFRRGDTKELAFVG